MANFFWIGLGANSNWSTIGNWSTTSGGSSNGAIPTTTSDVTFDGVGASGNTASIISASITILSLTFTSGYTNTITINTAVVLTIAGNFTDNTAHNWTVSGTGAMVISATSTIASGGKTFPGPVTFSGANTKTLSADWTISGALTVASTSTITSNILSCAGYTSTGNVSGTGTIKITGGTWTGAGATANPIIIAGNVTLGSCLVNGATLTYQSGVVTNTSSTLSIFGNCTLATSGMVFNNITVAATSTITINSLLSATGTLTISNAVAATFAGTSGFSVATLTLSHAANPLTQTFVNGVTYTITSALNCFLTRNGSTVLFTSDHATIKAIVTLNQGATCNCLANFTRIDASGGRTIRTFNGTITTCNNIQSFNDLGTIGMAA